MKFVYITDTHLKSRNPMSRKDNYYESIIQKFLEVRDYCNGNNIDFVVHGGDLFDIPKPSLTVVSDICDIINSFDCPFYVVPGNHDIYGYNLATLPQTMLGFLVRLGIVQLLTTFNSPITITREGLTLNLYGYEFTPNVRQLNFMVEQKPNTVNIGIAHNMIVPEKLSYDIDHISYDELETNLDLILLGHYHIASEVYKKGNTIIYNPGSVSRVDASIEMLNHNPSFVVVTVDNDGKISLETIKLKSAKAAEEVLDRTKIEERKTRQMTLDIFRASLNSTNLDLGLDINSLITDVAKELELSDDIVNTAFTKLNELNVNYEGIFDAENYQPISQENMKIKKVIIHNFESHNETEIEFVDGVNAIIGPTNSGKTAILNAIRWVFYNEPRGTAFITTGASKASVTVEFTNGYAITRERTKSNNGKYIITKPDGNKLELSGFGSSVPVDILNIHGSPKIKIFDNSISLNIMTQFELPFLLGLSATQRAMFIGFVGQLDMFDLCIKQFASESQSLAREMSQLRTELLKLEEQLKEFVMLPDCEIMIQKITNVLNELKTKEDSIQEFKNLYSALELIDTQLQQLQTKQQLKLIDITEYEQKLNEIESLFVTVKEIADIIQKFMQIKNRQSELRIPVSIDTIQEIENILNNAENKLKVVLATTEIIEEYKKLVASKQTLMTSLQQAKQRYDETYNQLVEYIKSSGYCPVCKSELDDTKIQDVINTFIT